MTIASDHKQLIPGTTGWSQHDLDDPVVARQWDAGRFEIIDGVLVTMPPAVFDHGQPVAELLYVLRDYLRQRGQRARVSFDVDLMHSEQYVLRVDGVVMTADDIRRQRATLRELGLPAERVGRLRTPPTLAIESVSAGHERHDRVTKYRLYAQFGLPNYWIVDDNRQSLECYRLHESGFVLDVGGSGEDQLHPSAFPGLVVDLKDIFL